MIRCWHIIALGLIALCSASTPALSQGRRAGPSERPEPLGAYVFQTEEEARQREEAASLSDRVSRVEGRLDGIEDATKRAAAAGEKAAGSQEVIETVGTCTKLITGLMAIILLALGVLGYRELQGIQAVRQRAEEALRKAEEAGKAEQRAAKLFALGPTYPEAVKAAERIRAIPANQRTPLQALVLDTIEDFGGEAEQWQQAVFDAARSR